MSKKEAMVQTDQDDSATAAADHVMPPLEGRASVVWDDSHLQTYYANVINIINTREEFSLFFGQNQTWDLATRKELLVRLDNRILLSPFAAKRLHKLLGDRLEAYESRFGPVNIGV